MKNPFSNELGLKVFATGLFDLQKTIPNDRYVENYKSVYCDNCDFSTHVDVFYLNGCLKCGAMSGEHLFESNKKVFS